MWTNLTFRGFDVGQLANWQRMPRLPHVVSICTEPPTEEPIDLATAKLRANLTWPSPDERDAMITAFISTARAKVEFDTGLALLTQTREVYLDVVTSAIIVLPEHSLPLQAVSAIEVTDTDGNVTTLDPATDYVVDLVSGRILLESTVAIPTARTFQAWKITIVSGWPDPATLTAQAPVLVQAVGLLTAHYATLGRDLATIERGTLDEIPQGYSDLLAPYAPVTVI